LLFDTRGLLAVQRVVVNSFCSEAVPHYSESGGIVTYLK